MIDDEEIKKIKNSCQELDETELGLIFLQEEVIEIFINGKYYNVVK